MPDSAPHRTVSDAVAERLRQDIRNKVYPEGTFLPTDARMTQIYNVSRMTMRAVVDRLEEEGLVHRVRGKGVQVRKHLMRRSIEIQGFSDLMAERGLTPGSVLYAFELTAPSEEAADALGIDATAPVFRIERLRTANGEPTALENSYLLGARFPDLEKFNITDYSLYEILFNHYHLEVSWAQDIITAVALTPAESEKLTGSELGFGLEIINTLYDVTNTPVEHTRTVYVPEQFSYFVRSDRIRRGQVST